MKKQSFISLVAYVNNEGKIVSSLLMSIYNYLDKYFEAFEIILVDDASEDDTKKKILKTAENIFCPTMLITMAWKQGVEAGIKAGVDLAIGDFVYEVDLRNVDYSLGLINILMAKAEKGNDIVAASAKRRTGLGLSIFYGVLNTLGHFKYALGSENLRLVSRRAINSVAKMGSKSMYRKILYKYTGFSNATVKYRPIKGKKLKKDGSLRDRAIFAIEVLVNHSNVSIYTAFWSFLLFCILLASWLILSVIGYADKFPEEIFMITFLMGLLSVLLLLIFIIKYFDSILKEIKNTPIYVIRSIERINNE